MATITLKGTPVQTAGNLPPVGALAPDFRVAKADLTNVGLKDFAGKQILLNIFPSVDTGICAASARKFNEEVSSIPNTVILCVSKDIPHALKRFCEAEGLSNIVATSAIRDNTFESAYGVKMINGAMEGYFSRAVVVIGTDGLIKYTEQVPEIAQEPNYEAALKALKA